MELESRGLDDHVERVEGGKMLGFVEDACFGFGVRGSEFVVVAKEVEKIRDKIPKTFKHK